MTVQDFLNTFSHGSVVFRTSASDGSFPILCRSDVFNRSYANISLLETFGFLDCRIVDIIQNDSHEVHVFIEE